MATQKEQNKLADVEKRLGKVEFRMDEIIIPKLNDVADFIENNKSGITLATLLNSRIISVVLGGIVAAGIFIAAKAGGSL